MTLQPANLAELSRLLAECHTSKNRVTSVALTSITAVREYSPEDMTVTAEGGLTLAALQATLATRGQWLPIDPPHADRITIRQLLAENLSGPHRCGLGTIREHLIGLEVVLADGRLTHSGGKVVKNVAGYDVLKLFVGARDSLGIITSATFKLRPLPEQEIILEAQFGSLAAAWSAIEAILEAPVTPVVLDLHNLAPDGTPLDTFAVLLSFAGTRAEVSWQVNQFGHVRENVARFIPITHALTSAAAFWSAPGAVRTESVLASKLPEALAALGGAPFIARAANGVIHHRCDSQPRTAPSTSALAQRLKDTFDPHHILPAIPS